MPIVDHATAAEVPWRPGYRRFTLAGEAAATTYLDGGPPHSADRR